MYQQQNELINKKMIIIFLSTRIQKGFVPQRAICAQGPNNICHVGLTNQFFSTIFTTNRKTIKG